MLAQVGGRPRAVRCHEELFAYWASLREERPAAGPRRPRPLRHQAPPADGQPDRRAPRRRSRDYRLRLAGTGLYGVYGREITGRSSRRSTPPRPPTTGARELDRVVERAAARRSAATPWPGAAPSHLSILWLRLPLASDGRRRRHDPGLRRARRRHRRRPHQRHPRGLNASQAARRLRRPGGCARPSRTGRWSAATTAPPAARAGEARPWRRRPGSRPACGPNRAAAGSRSGRARCGRRNRRGSAAGPSALRLGDQPHLAGAAAHLVGVGVLGLGQRRAALGPGR